MTRIRLFNALILSSLTFFVTADALAQPASRRKVERDIDMLRRRLNALERQFLAPAPEDELAYNSFLQQPDTGLIRLLPRERYDKPEKLTIRGGGAYYSFTRLTHEYGYGSDVELARGELSVGFAGADFGFLTVLGDVPLGSVSAEHQGVQFLAEFETPAREPQAREQQRRSSRGFQENGYTYINRSSALVGTTYALRSINYQRSDVLVALRVVRQDYDGSLIVLWKLLKQYPAPQLTTE